MIQTRYEFGDDLYSQVRWGDATLPPPGEGEGGGEGEISFFLYDGLGSTRSLTNASGAIVQSYNYRPFGETIDPPEGYSTNHLFTAGCSAFKFECKDREQGWIPPVWRAFQRLKGAKAR